MSDFFNTIHHRLKKRQHILFVFFVITILCVSYIFTLMFFPPSLSESKTLTIPEGYSFNKTAEFLEQEKIIHSALLFKVINKFDPISVKAGTYLFEGTQHLLAVKRRLGQGDYGDVYLWITIPEGTNNRELAFILEQKLQHFDSKVFNSLTKDSEGYLFPDTYAILPETSTKEMLTIMKTEFIHKTEPLSEAISKSGRTLDQIITMASLIEKEAGDDLQEQKMVAGILWKRFDKNMALQVDAPFLYIQGKTSKQLSIADLRRDGPYNTYTRTGLTPTPIGNPGMNAILAALYPQSSLYFYYLHDTKGNIHYGVTHDEHIRNKQRYL